MEKTAEQFLKENNVVGMTDLLTPMMIEFTKLHVEACKKDIINNVETSLGGDGSPLFSVVSILKSYPLEKIK